MREHERNPVRERPILHSNTGHQRINSNAVGRDPYSYGYNFLKGTTSYYFTNFLDDLGRKELWFCFLKWGKVRDIYVPPRRDKRGKRFGFVKFEEVKNTKVLEVLGQYSVGVPKQIKGGFGEYKNVKGYDGARSDWSYGK